MSPLRRSHPPWAAGECLLFVRPEAGSFVVVGFRKASRGRNHRPASFGMGGRFKSESAADFIGMRISGERCEFPVRPTLRAQRDFECSW